MRFRNIIIIHKKFALFNANLCILPVKSTYAILFCNFHYCSETQCHKFLTNCQNLHSLIITREGLILTLSILITLPGGIFGYHLVSKSRFILSAGSGSENPFPGGKIFQYSPYRGLSNYPRAMNTHLIIHCW